MDAMRTGRRFGLTLVMAAVLGWPPQLAGQSVPGELTGHKLAVPGEKVEGTTAKLSEVEAEMVVHMPPQGQAERLLQYAISRHAGATDEIKARVREWRGVVTFTSALDTLLDVARNGDDLRVRAAAIEIELAALNVTKTAAQVDTLLAQIARGPQDARQPIFILGHLANRGVETDRVLNELRTLTYSDQEMVRFQAYSSIATIGTDETVNDLVNAFHYDASAVVRIDAGGCGLAHCGMLTRAQRMTAVPGLIEMAEDRAVSAKDVGYAYRALREITDEVLPDDSRQWREWYGAHGAETTEKFRKFEEHRRP